MQCRELVAYLDYSRPRRVRGRLTFLLSSLCCFLSGCIFQEKRRRKRKKERKKMTVESIPELLVAATDGISSIIVLLVHVMARARRDSTPAIPVGMGPYPLYFLKVIAATLLNVRPHLAPSLRRNDEDVATKLSPRWNSASALSSFIRITPSTQSQQLQHRH